MKTMCPPGYHHNGFVATHALGHMMYGSQRIVHELKQRIVYGSKVQNPFFQIKDYMRSSC